MHKHPTPIQTTLLSAVYSQAAIDLVLDAVFDTESSQRNNWLRFYASYSSEWVRAKTKQPTLKKGESLRSDMQFETLRYTCTLGGGNMPSKIDYNRITKRDP